MSSEHYIRHLKSIDELPKDFQSLTIWTKEHKDKFRLERKIEVWDRKVEAMFKRWLDNKYGGKSEDTDCNDDTI